MVTRCVFNNWILHIINPTRIPSYLLPPLIRTRLGRALRFIEPVCTFAKIPPIPDTLWDCGWFIGLGIMLLQYSTTHMQAGEPRDWFQYYLLAGLTAFAITTSFINRYIKGGNHTWLQALIRIFKVFTTVYGMAVITFYLLLPIKRLAVLFSLTMTLALTLVWIMRWPTAFTSTLYRVGIYVFLLWALLACSHLHYTSQFIQIFANTSYARHTISTHTVLFFLASYAGSFLLACIALSWPSVRTRSSPALACFSVLLHLFTLLILTAFYFRTDGFYSYSMLHHWKALLEPAASVRGGGWLLWDVPSQYGFLLPLSIAFMPADNIWQAFYLFNGAMMVITGYLTFRLLFAQHHSLLGYVFALLVTLASTTVIQTISFEDQRIYPSAGSIRFLWVYILAGYVLHLYRQFNSSSHKQLPKTAYHIGMILFVLASLWSAESAVFAGIIWVPSVILIAIADRLSTGSRLSTGMVCRAVFTQLLWVILYVTGTISSLALFYYLQLGHLPDPSLFIVYSLAYKAGFGTIPIDHLGAVICLLYIFFLIAMILKIHVGKATLNAPNIACTAVLYAALSSLWAISSYFVSRSHDENILNITPVIVYICSLVLSLLPVLDIPALVKEYYKAAMAAFCGIILAASMWILLDKNFYIRLVSHPLIATVPDTDVIAGMYTLPVTAHILSTEMVNLVANEPVQSLDERLILLTQHFPSWILPNSITTTVSILPLSYFGEIAARRAERSCSNGWMIERKDNNNAWFINAISTYYKEIQTIDIAQWRFHHFEKMVKPFCS